MKGCRRCLTDHSALLAREAEVRRLARQLARADRPERVEALKSALAIEKANLTKERESVARGHDCDTRLVDEHPSRRSA